jgi:hypothetical protein
VTSVHYVCMTKWMRWIAGILRGALSTMRVSTFLGSSGFYADHSSTCVNAV